MGSVGDINPDLLIIKRVDDLTAESNPKEILAANANGVLVKTKYDDLKSLIVSSVKGEATPSSYPTPWAPGDADLFEKWDIKTAGTYTNFKDSTNASIVVSTADLTANFVQIWVKNGVSQKALSIKPAASPKTTFDPTNNVDSSVMKATADYLKKPESIGAVKVGAGPGESVATLNFISNGYIDANGNLVASAPHRTTDFIPVPDGFSMLQVDEAATFAVAYYTASQTFIKTVGGNVPGGAEYNKVFDFDSSVKFVKYIHTFSNIANASLKFVNAVYSLPWLKPDTVSKLAGKKIIWTGTSIPAGYPKQATQNTWAYPNVIANRNKATISNKGVPNGVIRKTLSNGGSMGARDTLSFTNTASAVNYQNAILDKIGTSEDPDIIVIDYGVNDYDADKSDIDNYSTFDMTTENLNTFMGSLNFVIKKILQAKPAIKIYIITHYSNSSKSSGITSFANLNAAILKVGQYWQIPTLQLCNETGWIVKNSVDIIATMCPDGIHPASKADTIAVNRLADIIEGFLLTR